MQRDGSSEDRATPASGREPPVIEAQAQDMDAAAAPAADGEQAGGPEQSAAGVAPPRKSGKGLLFGGVALVALAAAAAALWSTPALRERVAALTTQALEKPSDASPAPAAKSLGQSEKSARAVTPPASPALEARPAPDLPARNVESGAAANQPSPASPSPAQSPAMPAGQTPAAVEPTTKAPPTSSDAGSASSDSPKAETPRSAKPQSAKSDPDEATDEMEELSARIDALEAKLDASKTDAARFASGAQMAALSATLERLAGRLDAIESKLAAPKSEQRAPESRENGADAQSPAARVVVAQSLMQALTSGAPVGEHVAALRALGVDGGKLGDLAVFAQKGAPAAGVFAKQWVDLRSRIVTAETPAGGHWSDRLLARAKGLVRIEPIGAQTGESAAAVYSRVEAALQRGDLGAALRESDSLPEPARAVAADWRAGVAQRVKAESAARGVVSESIGALARPKS